MGGSIRLGRVLGFEIRLDYSWFVIFFLLAFSMAQLVFPSPMYRIEPGLVSWILGILGALLLFASVLVHEISHALVARRYGIEVAGITLFIFGGVAQIKGEPKEPKEEFFIAGIGPVVSIAIGIAFFILMFALAGVGVWREIVALTHYLAVINIILAVFNMIPGFPLDGGRILRSAIWHFTGSLKTATRWASYAGQAFAWLLIAWGIFQVFQGAILGGLWMVFIGWFLNGAAEAAYQQLLLRRALSGVPVSEVMSQHVPVVDADLRLPQFVEDYLLKREYTIYPVERLGQFVGVVTLDDVRKLDQNTWSSTSVGSVAHSPEEERVVQSHQDAWEALTQMMENDHQRLLVMRDGQLEGIISRDSIFNLVQRKMRLGLSS
jgi:Zn-dependent protease/CBS domain-containing protein